MIKLRKLRLRAQTDSGLFGVDIHFNAGLNVLWADNTCGKSTTLQALIYVLGLERMLSAKRDVPLPYAMTSHLIDPSTRASMKVVKSEVLVEIENDREQVLTVRREVVTDRDRRLVTVWDVPLLSEGTTLNGGRDYFVLDPGSAQREAGFHRLLVEFIGWKLPVVRKHDGSECLLYLETIFPLFYVEQKFAWSVIPAPFPSHFQIRDVSRRVVEFVMGLDTHERELARQQAQIDVANARAAWQMKMSEADAVARAAAAQAVGVKASPPATPQAFQPLEVALLDAASTKVSVELLEEMQTELSRISMAPPLLRDASPYLVEELRNFESRLDELIATKAELEDARRIETMHQGSISLRLQALTEDLQKNLDSFKLMRFGSPLAAIESTASCPTCAQPMSDSLLSSGQSFEVMPIEENINFVRAQHALFSSMAKRSAEALDELDTRIASVSDELNSVRSRLRILRADLTSPDTALSASFIEKRLTMQRRHQDLAKLLSNFSQINTKLKQIAGDFYVAAQERLALESQQASDVDARKLARFAGLIREQAQEYGFSTFPANELDVSADTYRPQKEEFELGFQLSASDTIRLKWAYTLGLLELARIESTNHLGLLIFDEPRQQEAKTLSFSSLLQRASASLRADQQVIFATSEDLSTLRAMIDGIDCTFLEYPDLMLARIES